MANGKNIIGDVFIHLSAKVHENAVIGPNVAIGPRAKIEKGTRIRNAIVLDDVTIQGIFFKLLSKKFKYSKKMISNMIILFILIFKSTQS